MVQLESRIRTMVDEASGLDREASRVSEGWSSLPGSHGQVGFVARCAIETPPLDWLKSIGPSHYQ